MRRKLKRYAKLIGIIREKHLPLFKSLRMVSKLKKEDNFEFNMLYTTDFMNGVEDTFMLKQEYYTYALLLNYEKNAELLDNKLVLFERCPDLMCRDYLNLHKADDKAITDFISNHNRFVGKPNYLACSKGFRVYTNTQRNLKALFGNDKTKILEDYICQHSVINKIYPSSVNTVRIHTVRNSMETKVFFLPKMRIGCDGSISDLSSSSGSYRLLLNDDGSVLKGFFVNNEQIVVSTTHHNTGVRFDTLTIPYIREAKEMCLKAAERFPECRYISWDIAITESGPVLVEGNNISGAFSTLQVLNYLLVGRGLREEMLAMFEFGMEGAPRFSEKTNCCLVCCKSNRHEDKELAVLIEYALHRNNILVVNNDDSASLYKCIIAYDETTTVELINTAENQTIKMKITPRTTVYEQDRQAMSVADKIMDLFS